MLREIERIIDDSCFVGGDTIIEFEDTFKNLCDANYCIACGNGTDALTIAIRCMDVKIGDEIIIPSHTWISTAEAVTMCGAKVRFCDTDSRRFTIDPYTLENIINEKTVGIIPVHLFGQSAEMDKIMSIAKKNKLWVIEDCAQAHLTKFREKYVGNFGVMGTFSFYPGKNLGAIGDAGAIVTNDREYALKARRIRNHGGIKRNEHILEGTNSRMDTIQASVLQVKTRYLKEWTQRRKVIAERYLDGINPMGQVELPYVDRLSVHTWHQFTIKTKKRDSIKTILEEKGIETRIVYPKMLSNLDVYKNKGYTEQFCEICEGYESEILSLPIYPEMYDEEVEYVIKSVNCAIEEISQ